MLMDMRQFEFWCNWLLAVFAIVILFGLALALLNWSPPFSFFNGLVDGVFWPGIGPSAGTASFRLWVYGMLGATMAGWGVTLSFLVRYPFAKKERWSWNAIAAGLVLWFVIDSGMSAYTQAYFNVGVNVLLVVLAGIPLLVTRHSFAAGKC